MLPATTVSSDSRGGGGGDGDAEPAGMSSFGCMLYVSQRAKQKVGPWLPVMEVPAPSARSQRGKASQAVSPHLNYVHLSHITLSEVLELVTSTNFLPLPPSDPSLTCLRVLVQPLLVLLERVLQLARAALEHLRPVFGRRVLSLGCDAVHQIPLPLKRCRLSCYRGGNVSELVAPRTVSLCRARIGRERAR